MQAVLVTPAGAVADLPNYQLPAGAARRPTSSPRALLANEEVSGRRGQHRLPRHPHVDPRPRRALLVVVATERVDLTVLHDALPADAARPG